MFDPIERWRRDSRWRWARARFSSRRTWAVSSWRTAEGYTVKGYRLRYRDELAVLISLVAAFAILISAVAGMWVWSSVSGIPVTITVEKGPDLP